MHTLPINEVDTLTKPAHARVWLFLSDQKFNTEQKESLHTELQAFLNAWASHGARLIAWSEIHYDQILVIALDESQAAASGCSQDALMRQIQEIERSQNISLLNRLLVPMLSGDNDLNVIPASQIPQFVEDNTMTVDSPMINMHLQNYGAVSTGEWIMKAGESWLKRYFSA